MEKFLWLACVAGLLGSSGCASERGRDQSVGQLSPQAQDEEPDYMDSGAFPVDPDYPENR
jgi:hypothetical protein